MVNLRRENCDLISNIYQFFQWWFNQFNKRFVPTLCIQRLALHMKMMVLRIELVVDPTWTGIQLMKVWDLSNKKNVSKKWWFYKQMECLCPKTNVGLYQRTLVSLATNTKYHQELLVLIILVFDLLIFSFWEGFNHETNDVYSVLPTRIGASDQNWSPNFKGLGVYGGHM